MNLTDSIRFYNQDCMKAMAQMKDNEFDLAIVDPPYGIDGNSHRQNKSRGKLAKSQDYHNALWDQAVPEPEYFKELERVTKNQIIFGINYFTSLHCFGGGRIVWDKVNGESSYSDAEIAYCSSIESVRLFQFMWSGMMQGSTANGSKQQGKKELNQVRIHPTEKPVHLYKWILKTFTKQGDTILDTHSGSLSLGLACDDLGFDLTAYELDKDYYEAAIKRFELVTSQTQIQF